MLAAFFDPLFQIQTFLPSLTGYFLETVIFLACGI